MSLFSRLSFSDIFLVCHTAEMYDSLSKIAPQVAILSKCGSATVVDTTNEQAPKGACITVVNANCEVYIVAKVSFRCFLPNDPHRVLVFCQHVHDKLCSGLVNQFCKLVSALSVVALQLYRCLQSLCKVVASLPLVIHHLMFCFSSSLLSVCLPFSVTSLSLSV